jgi:probable F420-dependent oxidoreductase
VAPGVGPFDADRLAALIDGLEERHFDTLWLSDVPLGPTVDPAIGLAFAASRTSRLKLGANVVPIGKNPMLLAKDLAQLDRVSNGRLLLSIVPGIGSTLEREALGAKGMNRGRYLDEVLPLLRRWWSGETVEYESERFCYPGVAVRPLPVQTPLELWLGGIGPLALERAGRLGDGWLGAAVTPVESGTARTRIQLAAAEAGRTVDPEHFGMSVPYARTDPPAASFNRLRERRPGVDVSELVAIGAAGLRQLLGSYAGEGISKFVLSPIGAVEDWAAELDWLAETVLDLQT